MREIRSLRRLALPIALVAAIAAACGGSGGPSASPTRSTRASSPGGAATPTPIAASPTSRTARPSATPGKTAGAGATDDGRFEGLDKCPQRPNCYLYEVARGDTLSRIASRFKTTVAAIREINPEIKNAAQIRIGDEIRIPSK